mgnify:CR=1 FL=1
MPAAPLRMKRTAPATSALGTVDALPGLGKSARTALAEHGIRTVADLVWLAPTGFDDLRTSIGLADAIARTKAEAEADPDARAPRLVMHARVKTAGMIPLRGRRAVRVVLADDTSADNEKAPPCTVHAFWFFLAHGVLALAKPDTRVLVVGRLRLAAKGPARIAHPDVIVDSPETRVVRARYPRLGPTEANLRKAIAGALAENVALDPVPEAIRTRENMPEAATLLREIHAQTGDVPSEAAKRAFGERLAWIEAFTRVWERLASSPSGNAAPHVIAEQPHVQQALERALGFGLTGAQSRAALAISKDLAAPKPMRRLLLGDVGTGKTAVALAAAAQCVVAGLQVAILAPTSVLAEQYVEVTSALTQATDARVAFLAGGVPTKERREAEAALANGKAQVAIGTHALLKSDLTFARLALVIVDEQQRLGVAQRLSLVQKGPSVHLLTLSATPIPRTLALALRGELATSVLDERPRGHAAVTTEIASADDHAALVKRAAETCARGQRVFWITPRIEKDEDEDSDDPLADAVARHQALSKALPNTPVLLLHGGMRPAEKRAAMQAFRHGPPGVLVSTTVVEVGVDVPDATLMVVENAEQYGMAQLHQLRGRVGRGAQPGTCVLVAKGTLAEPARQRLDALATLSSGEAIARADLALRGAGDLGGTRQHGPEEELLYLDENATYPWLDRIEADVRAVRKHDAKLKAPEHACLKSLVTRFGHVIAVREEAG